MSMNLNRERLCRRRKNLEAYYGVTRGTDQEESALVRNICAVGKQEPEKVRQHIQYLRDVAEFRAYYLEALDAGVVTRGGEA